jgi:A/G-specific adenine glycosylase
VWFSEVSPRPHDTGLVTLCSQHFSEFELHARAILGLPVDPGLREPGASAVIYGGIDEPGIAFEGVAEALAVPRSDLRLFGKPESFVKRRMGVAVANGETRGAILDGNVKRVLARCFAIDGFPGEKKVENRLWELAESLLPARGIETYTQALMDLGATVCTRGKPACARCPMNGDCAALAQDRVAELPAPRPRKAVPKRSARYLILRHAGRVLFEQRPPVGIWGGLLCLPELADEDDVQNIAQTRYGCRVERIAELPPLTHGFTHFTLTLLPLECRVIALDAHAAQPGIQWLAEHEFKGAALPAPVRRLLLAAGWPTT